MFFDIIMAYLPLTAISFVIITLLYKFYLKFRSMFQVKVNCWFCNMNFKVPFELKNSWICTGCDQYNGFNKHGDYNQSISAQYKPRTPACQYALLDNDQHKLAPQNGFCNTCNENQRLKIEKFSQFEPKNERNFDKEFKVYKASLEAKFRLCVSCERHLSRVLRDKKKMILGSKVAASFLRQMPKLVKDFCVPERIRSTRSSRLATLISSTLFTCSVINLVLTIKDFMLIGDKNSDDFHKAVVSILFPVVSFVKSMCGQFDSFQYPQFLEKLYLYITTLVCLFLGRRTFCLLRSFLRISLINSCSTCYAGMVLSFISNICDGLKLGKSTLLLTVWSIYAAIATNVDFYGADIIKVITSMVTVYLSVPNFTFLSKGTVLHKKANIFHRIFGDDYLEEDVRKIADQQFTPKKTSSASENSLLNSSFSSSNSFSTCSSSSRILRPLRRNTLNSVALEPSQSFTSCSQYNFNDDSNNSTLQNSLLQSTIRSYTPVAYSRPTSASTTYFPTCTANGPEYSFKNANHSSSLSPQPYISSYPLSNSLCSQNMLSPSRLNIELAFKNQQPTFSSSNPFVVYNNRYFNNSQQPIGQPKYILESTSGKENESRASSQSSGFESHGSSQSLHTAFDQFYCRNNSYCFHDDYIHNQCDQNRNPLRNGSGKFFDTASQEVCRQTYSRNIVRPDVAYSLPPNRNPPLSYIPVDNHITRSFYNNLQNSDRTSCGSPFDNLNLMSENLPTISKSNLHRGLI